ncbi:hypothetical protein Tco_1347603, partial [Tanacetum coccineum]
VRYEVRLVQGSDNDWYEDRGQWEADTWQRRVTTRFGSQYEIDGYGECDSLSLAGTRFGNSMPIIGN